MYDRATTDLLDHAVDRAHTSPPEMRDAIARPVMADAGQDTDIDRLTPEEQAARDGADAAIARGGVATATDVEAVFSGYRA